MTVRIGRRSSKSGNVEYGGDLYWRIGARGGAFLRNGNAFEELVCSDALDELTTLVFELNGVGRISYAR